MRNCLKLNTHYYRVLPNKDYAAKTDGCLEIVGDCILLKRTYFFFSSTMLNGGHRKKMVWFFCMSNSRQFQWNYKLLCTILESFCDQNIRFLL